MTRRAVLCVWLFHAAFATSAARAQTAENVALIVNDRSGDSQRIADHYARSRHFWRYRVIPTAGASEGFVPEDAELLIEGTETGRTLVENQLKAIDVIFRSTTCVIVRKGVGRAGGAGWCPTCSSGWRRGRWLPLLECSQVRPCRPWACTLWWPNR